MKLGEIEIYLASGGKYWLDGGTMYGVIPKVLWEKHFKPDEKNRIELETNCPLIRASGKWVLLDTGSGTKFSEKEQSIYKIEPKNHLFESITKLGVQPEAIDYVIPTHLHFDHIGGGTIKNESGKIVPAFPNARYVFQKGEWEKALENYGVMSRTYLKENLIPLQEANLIDFVEGDAEIIPGIKVIKTGGHTPDHQIVQLESCGKKAVFLGDLVPTTSHLPYAWIMAYDLFPLDTLNIKKDLLKTIVKEKWLVLWDHDPKIPAGMVEETSPGRFHVSPVKIEASK